MPVLSFAHSTCVTGMSAVVGIGSVKSPRLLTQVKSAGQVDAIRDILLQREQRHAEAAVVRARPRRRCRRSRRRDRARSA